MSKSYDNAVDYLTKKGINFTILKLAVNPTNQELYQIYENAINESNNNLIDNSYPNAGFDLFLPDDYIIQPYSTNMISMEVKTEMTSYDGYPCAFYMYARSSISKTPLILANSVGIIDSGYRGNIIGAFRSVSSLACRVDKFNRLVQLTNAYLTPIVVKLVDESELSITQRGSGGFGSTGA